MKGNLSLFEYGDFKHFVQDRLAAGARGMQAQMARSVGCQAIHIINVLRGKAQFTEDQAFRVAKFLRLADVEIAYFLDLVRYARSAEPETKSYLKRRIEAAKSENSDLRRRVSGVSLPASLEDQVQYYGTPATSLVHVATSCGHLQTAEALAKWLKADINEIRRVLDFLVQKRLVEKKGERYSFGGSNLHLGKDSPLHFIFQKNRREVVMEQLARRDENKLSLNFSTGFATSKKHLEQLKRELAILIEKTHRELAETASEEVAVLVIDLCHLR